MALQSLRDKIPPHNAEAERATLGAVLLDPDAIQTVLRFLRPDDFYVNANKSIFFAVISLFEKGQKADLITLIDELKLLGRIDEAGGPGYVAALTDSVPSSANVEYYAKIVRETSVRRSLIRLSQHVSAKSFDETVDCGLVLDEAQQRIFEISQNRQTLTYKSIRELLPDTMKTIETLYRTKNQYSGIASGFDHLDAMTSGFQNSEFIIIGARPSVGKTAFALNIASNIAIRGKHPTAFFTLEMTDMAITQRILASEARINSKRIQSGLIKQSELHDLMEAAGRIYEAPLYIIDMPNMPLLDLRTMARRLKSEKKVEIIFIDYLTLVTHENTDIPRWEQISSISRSLKALARELRIPVVALSQLTRTAEGKEPTLADIRESGSIEQDADLIMFIHRNRETDKSEDERPAASPTKLLISKQRNGPVGTVNIVFIPQYTRFEAVENRPH
ncbi:MAG: replicative DNA helicase [Spirochaetes bacterium]|nr:replicative DNA helicase [Spirochaetota bacterium]